MAAFSGPGSSLLRERRVASKLRISCGPINPLMFVIAAFVSGIVALTTVSLQASEAASNDPVGALRQE